MRRFAARRLIVAAGIAVAGVSAGMMSSCSGDRGKVLDLLPADTRAVAVVNVDELAKEAGSAGSMAMLGSLSEDGRVTFVSSSSAKQYSVVIPKDMESVRATLADSGYTSVSDGDYEVYSRSNRSAIVLANDGSGAWETGEARPAEFVKTQHAESAQASMSALKGVAEYIESEKGIVTGAVSQRAMGAGTAKEGESWYCFNGKQESGVLGVAFSIMEQSGKPVKIKGLKRVDTDFLRYVNGGTGVVGAVGLTPELDWDAAGRMATSLAGTEASRYIPALLPYLKSIDGTVAVAVSPKDPENLRSWNDPEQWNLLLMARMPQERVDEALRTVGVLATMAGAKTVADDKSGITRIEMGGIQLYAGNVDGNFAISTTPLDGKGENDLTTTFEGKNGGVVANVPAELVFGASEPGNMLLKIQIEESGGKIEMSLHDGKDNPLKKLTATGMSRMPGF